MYYPFCSMVWCRLVWCGVRYVIWSGADWSGGVCYVDGLVCTGLVQSVMVYGFVQPGLVQSCYDLFQSGLRW